MKMPLIMATAREQSETGPRQAARVSVSVMHSRILKTAMMSRDWAVRPIRHHPAGLAVALRTCLLLWHACAASYDEFPVHSSPSVPAAAGGMRGAPGHCRGDSKFTMPAARLVRGADPGEVNAHFDNGEVARIALWCPGAAGDIGRDVWAEVRVMFLS